MPKGTGLGNIFSSFLWKGKKQLIFLTAFYIFHKSGIKTFLNGLLTNALRAPVNRTLSSFPNNQKMAVKSPCKYQLSSEPNIL